MTAINKVEDTARRELMAVTKQSADNNGQLKTVIKVVFSKKEK